MRKIIIVGDESDRLVVNRQYWDNFVARVRMAIERDKLDAQIHVCDPLPEFTTGQWTGSAPGEGR